MKILIVNHILYTFVLISSSIQVAYAQPGLTFGGTKFDRGIYIHKTSDNNLLSVGYSNSFSEGGDDDYWVIKTKTDGTKIWDKLLGGKKNDTGFGFVELPAHQGYIVIGFSRSFGADEDILLYKLTEQGEISWTKNLDRPGNERAWSIKPLADGNYIIVGQTQHLKTRVMSGMMTKIDKDGNILWQKTYGTEAYNRIYYVVENVANEMIISGLTRPDSLGPNTGWILHIDAKGEQLNSQALKSLKNITPHGIMKASGDKILLVGYAQVDTTVIDQRSFYMAWLNNKGKVEKEFTNHEPGLVNHGLSGVINAKDEVIMTGYTKPAGGNIWDGIICKFEKDGKLIWRKTYGSTKSDQFYTITTVNENEFAITGHTNSFGAGDADLWLLRIDDNGEILR